MTSENLERHHFDAMRARGRLLALLAGVDQMAASGITDRINNLTNSLAGVADSVDPIAFLRRVVGISTFPGTFDSQDATFIFNVVGSADQKRFFDRLDIHYSGSGHVVVMYGQEGPRPAFWREPGGDLPIINVMDDYALRAEPEPN